MLSLVRAWIIVMLSCMACLSQEYLETVTYTECGCAVPSQLVVPRSRLKGFGNRAFSIAAPKLWNALPGSLTYCKSVGAYKKTLGHICLNLLLNQM